jgi:hypothetical protein
MLGDGVIIEVGGGNVVFVGVGLVIPEQQAVTSIIILKTAMKPFKQIRTFIILSPFVFFSFQTKHIGLINRI